MRSVLNRFQDLKIFACVIPTACAHRVLSVIKSSEYGLLLLRNSCIPTSSAKEVFEEYLPCAEYSRDMHIPVAEADQKSVA